MKRIMAIFVTEMVGTSGWMSFTIEASRSVTIEEHSPQDDGDRFYWDVNDDVGRQTRYFQGHPGVWKVASEKLDDPESDPSC